MKILSTLILACYGLVSMAQGTQLLRQPSISNTEVVFVYANDLWKTSINGGNAVRLTSNEGYEQKNY
jgi:tricorn protease